MRLPNFASGRIHLTFLIRRVAVTTKCPTHQRQQLAEQLLRTARKCRPKTSSDSNGSCLEQLLPEPHRLRSSPTPPLAFGGVAYVWRCKDKRRHLLTLAAVAVEHRKYPPQMGFQLAATVSHQPAIVLSSVAAHPATWTGHCRGAQIKMKSKWGPIITTSFAGAFGKGNEVFMIELIACGGGGGGGGVGWGVVLAGHSGQGQLEQQAINIDDGRRIKRLRWFCISNMDLSLSETKNYRCC
uniref:HDC06105 n=1 Tax=Drosophila melanogaster TaxID=7227 RepID=Q6IGK3_DROME|nr:TPA_inf: HDC06105 [Drosophila melanogaster]